MKKYIKKRTVGGVTALIISQCIVKIFGLVYKLYLANKDGFGDAGNAIYNGGFHIYALLLTISSIGVPNAMAKLIAERNYIGDRQQVGSILKTAIVVFSVIGIFFSALLAILSGVISENIINMEETKYTIVALAPAIFNVCLISAYRGFYNGTNKIDITAKSQTIEQIYKTVFTILLVEIFYYISGKCTVVLAIVANFATTLATFSSLFYLSKKCEIKIANFSFSRIIAKKILKLSIPISLSAILASLNRIIDSSTVVRFLKNTIGEQKARIQYGILSGKVDVLSTVPISFVISVSTTIIPIVSSFLIKGERKKISNVIESYMLYTIVLIMPCCAGMLFFSDNIMQLLFNSTSGSILLKISAISMLFISLEQIIHAVLQGIGATFAPAFSLGCGVIMKLALNIFLLNIDSCEIWLFGGINGACFATLVCHFITFVISFTFLRKKINFKIDLRKYIIKPICATLVMVVFSKMVENFYLGIFTVKIATITTMITAGTVYIIAISTLRVLSKDEIKMIPILSNLINFAKK